MNTVQSSQPAQPTQRKVYSISELTREVRMTLETGFTGVWLEGEISNFLKHTSGHMYFSLKDENAQISAVMFRGVNQGLRFEIKDGLKVLAFGKVTVYEKRGQYQIVVEKIEPKGVGALELALRQLTEKLRREGLFDPAHKKSLPFIPERIGVVTSPTGAVIRDILNITKRRFPGIPVLLYPVKVQGEGAREEIAKAIEDMNRWNVVDILIVGRGGGSLEDLWAFNEEIVARAIYNSRIPVVSAVGHEIDVTIADLVADRRAPTPSAAAEMVVPSRDEILGRLAGVRERISRAALNLIADRKEQVLNLKGSYALAQPGRLIEQAKQRLDEITRQLGNYLKNFVGAKKARFEKYIAQLEALSPLAILSRGYSLTVDETKKLIRDTRNLKEGELVMTQLGKGSFRSRVVAIEKSGKIF